jgi:all-trans-retinol 13,14-reductase
MYGLEHTPARFEANRLRVETSIKNFFLTGQDMVCVGVGASIASGMITSSLILKKNLMSTVHSYNFKKDSQLSKSVSDSKVLQISEGFFRMKDWFSSKEK